MRLRKKVEMLFAHLKRILGLGRLRLRGPSRDHGYAMTLPGSACGANDEFLLAATAQNLCKLAKIFPAPQQTRKARQKGARALFRTTLSATETRCFSTDLASVFHPRRLGGVFLGRSQVSFIS